MNRFLAIHRVPAGATPDSFRDVLARLAIRSHARGLRPLETFYSLERGRAYTLVEAATEADVRAAFLLEGANDMDVVPGERVFTELLDEPRRAR